MPSPQEIGTWSQELSAAVMHPEFLKALEEVLSLPEAQRSQAVFTQLAPQALAARGVPVPQGMRVSTRFFENPDDRTMSAAGVEMVEPDVADVLPPSPPNGVLPPTRYNVCITLGVAGACFSAGMPRVLGLVEG
jgi:hypothetical protein